VLDALHESGIKIRELNRTKVASKLQKYRLKKQLLKLQEEADSRKREPPTVFSSYQHLSQPPNLPEQL
jgi:hypothetical protein